MLVSMLFLYSSAAQKASRPASCAEVQEFISTAFTSALVPVMGKRIDLLNGCNSIIINANGCLHMPKTATIKKLATGTNFQFFKTHYWLCFSSPCYI